MDHVEIARVAKEKLLNKRIEFLRECKLSIIKKKELYDYQNVPFVKQVLGLKSSFLPLSDTEKNMAIDVVLQSSVYEKVDEAESKGMAEFDYADQLIKELLNWYKTEFFTWVNKPPCIQCGNKDEQTINGIHPVRPYKTEHFKGKAYIVERYLCSKCNSTYEFPRFNDICTLLKERRGRCGEWNNCFIAILRSLDIDTRLIWNAEDHVWCEYYSNNQKRWVHIDSCENAYDQPLLYNKGWNKKMSYTFAVNECYILDISEKYLSPKKPELHLPRNKVPDHCLKIELAYYNICELLKLSRHDLLQTTSRLISDYYSSHSEAVSRSTTEVAKPRQSGKGEWTKIRGEDG